MERMDGRHGTASDCTCANVSGSECRESGRVWRQARQERVALLVTSSLNLLSHQYPHTNRSRRRQHCGGGGPGRGAWRWDSAMMCGSRQLLPVGA